MHPASNDSADAIRGTSVSTVTKAAHIFSIFAIPCIGLLAIQAASRRAARAVHS